MDVSRLLDFSPPPPGVDAQREDEAGLASILLHPRFISFCYFGLLLLVQLCVYSFVIFILVKIWGSPLVFEAWRRNPVLSSAFQALCSCAELLIRRVRLPSGGAAAAAATADAAAAATIASASLLQSQQSTTDGGLSSQQSTVEEMLQPHQSITGGEHQHSTVEAQLAVAAQEELQPPRSQADELVILQESFLPINIWDGDSLRQGLRNMIACFKRINHPIQFVTACSPIASNSSSPRRYEYTYGVASVTDEYCDQHHQFKSLFLLDKGDVDLINRDSLFRLEMSDMSRQLQIVEPGYQKILYKVLVDNSSVLDSFLYDYFNSAGVYIDIWACMDESQFTDQFTKICVMNLKVAAGLLCLMWNELDEAKCVLFHNDLKAHYFTLCARRPIANLIEAADSISNLKWSASHIYPMLVLYEAIVDVLSAFGNPNESDRIYQQMRVNFEGIFDGIKCSICDILNYSPCADSAVTRVRHPATDFLVHSLKLFKNHCSIVQHICVVDGSSSLGHLLSEVISHWAEELKKHSVSCGEGRNCIFLLNNLTDFTLETVKLLQLLMSSCEHDKIHNLLHSLITKYTLKYLEHCWGPLRQCVELNSGTKPCLASLNAFTSQFNTVCDCQGTWVLQAQLKENLRGEILRYITPSYDIFFKKVRKRILLRAKLFCQNHGAGQQVRHKTTQELEYAVGGLFESEHTE